MRRSFRLAARVLLLEVYVRLIVTRAASLDPTACCYLTFLCSPLYSPSPFTQPHTPTINPLPLPLPTPFQIYSPIYSILSECPHRISFSQPFPAPLQLLPFVPFHAFRHLTHSAPPATHTYRHEEKDQHHSKWLDDFGTTLRPCRPPHPECHTYAHWHC